MPDIRLPATNDISLALFGPMNHELIGPSRPPPSGMVGQPMTASSATYVTSVSTARATPAPMQIPVHRTDDRLREFPHLAPDVELSPQLHPVVEDGVVGRRVPALLGHVVTDAEGSSGATQHEAVHLAVSFELVEASDELVEHLSVEGVQFVGAVQREARDRPVRCTSINDMFSVPS